MKKLTLLFLDDIRNPDDPYVISNIPEIRSRRVYIVRSYHEFVKWIAENGLPDEISFDHDLADEHYVPSKFWNDYDKSREYQEQQTYTEKTGYDCARWLVEYCQREKQRLPGIYIHSANPVGANNIRQLLYNAVTKLGLGVAN